MAWKVIQFESLRGEKFVKEFIDRQNPAVKAKFIRITDNRKRANKDFLHRSATRNYSASRF